MREKNPSEREFGAGNDDRLRGAAAAGFWKLS
jgi:hypothetical protein